MNNVMSKVVSVVLATFILAGGVAPAAERKLGFERSAAGEAPAGWKAAETQGKGTLAAWKVAEDPAAAEKGKVVTIAENHNGGGTYSLLLAERARFKDLKLKMTLKAVAGKEDQGGGPLWRARDANNYYVARWNPLETNLRLYTVREGKRVQLATVEKLAADPKAWHTIEIEQTGSHIVVAFDGKRAIEVDDATFTEAGQVGLWIKADGRSTFGPLTVESQEASGAKGGKKRPAGAKKQE